MDDILPQKIEKPWGFELLFAHNTKYAGKVIFVKKGHRLSLQYHEKKDECLYLQDGKARVHIEEPDGQTEERIVEAGQRIPVPPHTRHRLDNALDFLCKSLRRRVEQRLNGALAKLHTDDNDDSRDDQRGEGVSLGQKFNLWEYLRKPDGDQAENDNRRAPDIGSEVERIGLQRLRQLLVPPPERLSQSAR